jgi:hypothetical protein
MTDLESQEEDSPDRIFFSRSSLKSLKRFVVTRSFSWIRRETISVLVPFIRTKKDHDWEVDQLVDLFRTTHQVKTKQHVTKNRGRHCGDIELTTYLSSSADPLPLVLDLRIVHDRFGSSLDPSLQGHLHFPNDIDKSLNETTTDKIRKYRAD